MPAASATVLGMSLDVELEVGRQDEESVARLLRALPEWFGLEAATQSYIDDARTFPTVLAQVDGAVVGALLWKRHYPESAEVHLMAVEPSYHRAGSARACSSAPRTSCVPTVSATSRSRPWALLVPTTSTSGPAGSTRPAASSPLEELFDVWPEDNPMLILVKAL